MVAVAQAGLLGFAPQYTMESTPSGWLYHKALDIDLSAIDDQRLGPPEIGGRPLPTIPYKAGITVGGGFTCNPRLENSIGWLLYGALGYKTAAVQAVCTEYFLAPTLLTTGSSGTLTIPTTVTAVPGGTGKISIKISKGDDLAFTPTVTLTGTNVSDGAQTEDFDFSLGPTTGSGQRAVGLRQWETIVGGKNFKTVTQIAVAKPPSGTVYIEVGFEDPVVKSHVFKLDTSAPELVRWMAFRKYIPRGEDVSLPYGEEYNDCKISTIGLTLPNNDLISARVDMLGRTFQMKDDPFNISTGEWAHGLPTTEDYLSVPIGCNLAGYVRIPAFSGADLAVIACTVNWTNTPLDPRQQRVFGSPYLTDVTVVGRALAFDMTVVWKNPELYKAIYGNSKTATAWSAIPFTSRLDVQAFSPGAVGANYAKYGLRVEAQKVMLAITGGIRLVGNQSVTMRLTGTALDVTGDYVAITLENAKGDADYTWPAS